MLSREDGLKFTAIVGLVIAFSGRASAQDPNIVNPTPLPALPSPTVSTPATPPSLPGDYHIGKDDILDISVLQAPELKTTVLVPASGMIPIPWIGNIRAGGFTTDELTKQIAGQLQGRYINDPFVTVSIRQYASQPVSILGMVRAPGVKQLKGEKTLLDLLVLAEGVDPLAGVIQIIRYNYNQDGTRSGIAEKIDINAEDLLKNGNTDLNVLIRPGDVVNVLRAGTVRVFGEVKSPAEIVMRSGKNLNVTQAIIFSGGFTRTAKQDNAFILRYGPDGVRREIPVSAGKIVKGEAPEVNLQPDDILFVPNSKTKTGARTVTDSAVSSALYTFFRVLVF